MVIVSKALLWMCLYRRYWCSLLWDGALSSFGVDDGTEIHICDSASNFRPSAPCPRLRMTRYALRRDFHLSSVAPMSCQPITTRRRGSIDAGANGREQRMPGSASSATRNGREEFADVYTIAAVVQECYRNINMWGVVAGRSVVRVSWDRCAYIFSDSS